MTFRETLDAHLRAIQGRDLDALVATLPPDAILLVMSDGTLARTTAEFVEAHRGWFAAPSWTIGFEEVHAFESDDLAVATFKLDYRDAPSDAPPIHEQSYLTLAFERRGDRWVMILDQNTPIRAK